MAEPVSEAVGNSAAVVAIPEQQVDVDRVIRRVVRALIAVDEVSIEDVCAGTGIPDYTLFRRLGGKGKSGFTAAEVGALSVFFDLPAGEFYSPGEAFGERIRKRGFFREHELAA